MISYTFINSHSQLSDLGLEGPLVNTLQAVELYPDIQSMWNYIDFCIHSTVVLSQRVKVFMLRLS